METKINIAEILKDKPQGTKLYSPICGECKLSYIESEKSEPQISTESDAFGVFYFWDDGKAYNEGECLLFPSDKMRDWAKFAWKKGDVLVHKDGDVHIIFERFVNDTYCSFVGKYYLWKENNDTEQFYINERMLTSDFQKAGKDAAQTYINTIEKRLGGKLNLDTLEIEKQTEFKDGDIVMSDSGTIVLVRGISLTRKIYYHAYMRNEYIYINQVEGEFFSRISRIKRFATDSEKQQFFDALEKEGKAWDAEKKQIVDLKPKVELKPFDKVLVRNDKEDQWSANIFSYQVRDMYHCLGECYWRYCIPYEGNEHLLGTTNNVED